MNIEFVDELPPKIRNGESKYPPLAVVAATLRTAEGKWAKIRTYPSDKKVGGYVFASQQRAGKHKFLLPTEGFEVETRLDKETGELNVFARFVGDFQ